MKVGAGYAEVGLEELRITNYELRKKTAKKLSGRTNPIARNMMERKE